MSDLDRAFPILIDVEKGYANDPEDPGGETKYGVCKRDYPGLDIPNLTIDVAKDIFATNYWFPAGCDKLPWPLSFFVFDAAVNQGAENARLLLQKALGVKQDGILGNNTLMAIRKRMAEDPTELCALFMADRGLRYTGTRKFDRYGRGWFKRLFKVALESVK